MSALRNYRRSLSERRESVSEIYQQDAKRIGEMPTATTSWQASSRRTEDPRSPSSSDEDEDVHDGHKVKEGKPKPQQQRRFSLDFLFRKSKPDEKKKTRSHSTAVPPPQLAQYSGGTGGESEITV